MFPGQKGQGFRSALFGGRHVEGTGRSQACECKTRGRGHPKGTILCLSIDSYPDTEVLWTHLFPSLVSKENVQRCQLHLSGSASHRLPHPTSSLCRGHLPWPTSALWGHIVMIWGCRDLEMKQRLIVEGLVPMVDLVVGRSWVTGTLT